MVASAEFHGHFVDLNHVDRYFHDFASSLTHHFSNSNSLLLLHYLLCILLTHSRAFKEVHLDMSVLSSKLGYDFDWNFIDD
jgi:hypothetical protein